MNLNTISLADVRTFTFFYNESWQNDIIMFFTFIFAVLEL